MTLRKWDITRVALCLAGLAVMVYLTVVHYSTSNLLACPESRTVNCQVVLTSPQSELSGVPITLFGIGWFAIAGLFALSALAPRLVANQRLAMASLLWTVGGTAYVVYLVYVEFLVIGALCLWCTVAHVIIGGMLVIEVVTHPDRGQGMRPGRDLQDARQL